LLLTLLAFSVFVLCAVGAVRLWLRYASSLSGESPVYLELASDKSTGVNANLHGLGLTDAEQYLVSLEDAGFTWLRHRFPWDAIETSPGQYDWGDWDVLVERVADHGLELVAVLDGSPIWERAEADVGNSLGPPVDTRGFGDFVTAFASRYGEQVDYYQIWDEPNIAPHWGAGEINPAAYVRLLREGAIRVRAADSDSVVLLAALAPNVEAGGENMSDLAFLDAVYRAGGAEWFDVVAAQLYGFESPIAARPDAGELNWRRVELLRDTVISHGDEDTAVWAVSFGVPVAGTAEVGEAVDYARSEWPWMGLMLWAALIPTDQHGEYALLSDGGQPEAAFAEVVRGVAQRSERAWPGVYPADHPTGQYHGNWRVTPSGADIGSDGDQLTIPFHGTRLDLAVRRGSYRAFLFVSVDGKPANELPIDSEGQAYVVLYDPLHQVDVVTLARGLSDGDHVAEIVAERGWGQWAILGWTVSRETPGSSPWLAAVLTFGAVLAMCVAAWAAWPARLEFLQSASALTARYRALDDRVALAVTAAVAVVLYVMVGTVPVLLMLGVLVVLLLLRPDTGLPLIALSLPFYQPGRPILGKVFSMVEILLLLTAMGWGVNWLLTRRTDSAARTITRLVRRLSLLDWGIVALIVVGASSLLWAEQAREAAREFRVVVLEAGIFYGLLRAMLPRLSSAEAGEGRAVWRVVDAWMLGGMLIATVGLSQWIFGENLITAEGVGRVRGFYGSPNNLALYLGRLLPLAAAFAAWGQSGLRRWVYLSALLLMVGAMFLTYSRGAWVVGVPASLLFLAAVRGRRTLVVTLGVLAVIAIIVFAVSGAGRLTTLLDTGSGTTFFRIQLWRSSMAMIKDHPLLGVGLDNFLYVYRTSYVQPSAWAEFDLSHPHNFMLDFWLRLGIPGLVTIILLLVAFFRKAWASYCRLDEDSLRLLVLGLMAGMVSFVAHGLVDNAFFLVDLAFVFVLMIALAQTAGGESRGIRGIDEGVG